MRACSEIRKFEDLFVWQKAMNFSVEIYRITAEGRFARDFGLRSQIQRASVSILSNIAEGFGKFSNQEFRKYLAIANGSSFEVRAQLHLARELGYINDLEAGILIKTCTDLSKLIIGLRRSIK